MRCLPFLLASLALGARSSSPPKTVQISAEKLEIHPQRIEWDTGAPLLLDVVGYRPLIAQIGNYRRVSDIAPALLRSLHYITHMFSEVEITVFNASAHPISTEALEQAVHVCVESPPPVDVEACITQQNDFLSGSRKVAWKLIDPAGLVSSAGEVAREAAQRQVTALLQSEYVSSAISDEEVQKFATSFAHVTGRDTKGTYHTIAVASPFAESNAMVFVPGDITAPGEKLTLEVRLNLLSFRLLCYLLLGMLGFFNAHAIASSVMLYYGFGFAFGSIAAVTLMLILLFRNRQNKLVIGGSILGSIYGILHSARLNPILQLEEWLGLPSFSIVYSTAAFVILSGLLVSVYLYVQGPVENPRLINVIAFIIRTVSVVFLINCSYAVDMTYPLVMFVISFQILSTFMEAVGACCPCLRCIPRCCRSLCCCSRPEIERRTLPTTPLGTPVNTEKRDALGGSRRVTTNDDPKHVYSSQREQQHKRQHSYASPRHSTETPMKKFYTPQAGYTGEPQWGGSTKRSKPDFVTPDSVLPHGLARSERQSTGPPARSLKPGRHFEEPEPTSLKQEEEGVEHGSPQLVPDDNNGYLTEEDAAPVDYEEIVEDESYVSGKKRQLHPEPTEDDGWSEPSDVELGSDAGQSLEEWVNGEGSDYSDEAEVATYSNVDGTKRQKLN